MTISNDKIYQIIEQMNSNVSADILPENLLKSIEKGFQKLDKLDHLDTPNFLNFVVEEYNFFSSCKNAFERIKQMCTNLMNSNQLSSKVIGVTSLTKLWLNCYHENQGLDKFIEFLYKNSTDSNFNNMDNPPHLRSVYSQCLLEIYYAAPDQFNLTFDQIMETANSTLIPTSFPELALAMKGECPEMEEYIKKRWWSFSPIETSFFAPTYQPQFPAPPSDPLLLHIAMQEKKVPKETALTLLNSPMSQLGDSSVILSFKDAFEFEGSSLFTPFDSSDLIAAKSLLLPSTMKSIEANPILADFVHQPPTNSIVKAVFSIASRFSASDLFSFFRNYFESTPAFDSMWLALYNKQPASVQSTLRCFLQQFPERQVTIESILSSGSPTFSVINQVTAKNAPDFAGCLKSSCGHNGSVETAYLAGQIDNFLKDEATKASLAKAVNSGPQEEPPFQLTEASDQFVVIEQSVESSNITTTKIDLKIQFKPPVAGQTIYGVTFSVTNDEFFDGVGIKSLPMMSDTADVHFELRPLKAGNCNLAMSCDYTTEDGTPVRCKMNFLKLTVDMLLSPMEKDADPSMVGESEESRRVLDMPFDEFEQKIKKTVFGKFALPTEDKSKLKSHLMTPDLHSISFEAVGIEKETSVNFKAPNLDILLLIDEFIENFFESK